MKKVIALALAVVLSLSMAAVAFAAPTWNTDYEYTSGVVNGTALFNPNSEIALEGADFGISDTEIDKYFTAEYFTVTIKYEKGGNLVDSVKFDEDGWLVIKLKENTALNRPVVPNLDIKELTVKAKKDMPVGSPSAAGDIKRGDTFSFDTTVAATLGNPEPGYVGYVTFAAITVGDPVEPEATKTSITKGYYKFAGTSSLKYETSSFKFGPYAYGEMRVYDKDKFFLAYNESINVDIVKQYPDAELYFVNLTGAFNTSMAFELYAEEDEFVYEIKDGKLVKSSLKWNNDVSAWTGKVRSLGKYVVSDVELVLAAADEADKNPDTGASDVVGVAAALAVVSLVAAGAVALKK